MNLKIKILIGVLIIGILLISGWWIWRSQKQASIEEFCTSSVLEDCYGKKVKVIGTFEALSKGCNGGIIVSSEREETIFLPEFTGKCEAIKQYENKKVELVGTIEKHVCPPATQCWGKMVIKSIDSIKVLENQTKPTKEIIITTDKTEYKLGECVKIEIRNEGKKTVCLALCDDCPCFLPKHTCPRFCYAFSFEKKQDHNNYKITQGWTKGWKCENSTVGKSLNPGESIVLTYCISQNPSETAFYRVAIPLSDKCQQKNFELDQVFYSNDFVIKKVDFPFVAGKVNFFLYPSGEIAIGNGINTRKTIVKMDINGDGKEEKIYVDEVMSSEKEGYYILHIDNQNKKITNFRITDFSIVDIDKSDNYQEVVLHNPGPSNDDESLFFWYNGCEIKEIGKLARWVKILGNGKVEVGNWMGFWTKIDTYVLDKGNHLLRWLPKKTYKVGIKTKARGTVHLYKEKSYDSEIIKEVKQGEKVEILIAENCDTYFCEWFQLKAGEVTGWVKQSDFEDKLELNFAD
ncbi:hypothetical protein J7K24_02950 [bacterium]|nr:hypothetical protein [bacterium]